MLKQGMQKDQEYCSQHKTQNILSSGYVAISMKPGFIDAAAGLVNNTSPHMASINLWLTWAAGIKKTQNQARGAEFLLPFDMPTSAISGYPVGMKHHWKIPGAWQLPNRF